MTLIIIRRRKKKNVANGGFLLRHTVVTSEALTTGLFVFSKIDAQEQYVLYSTASLIRDLNLEQSMPAADERARSGSMLASGIFSRKL